MEIDGSLSMQGSLSLEGSVAESLPQSLPSSVSKKRFQVVSMFSGCGGMDLGFKGGFSVFGQRFAKRPFEVVWANDLNASACATYAENVGKHIRCGDVWSLLDTMPASADVVIGGFPCQDISINGKRRGIAGSRSGLYRAMVEAVRMTRPAIFVAENVKGLLMKGHEDDLAQVVSDFSGLGYDVSYKLYLAADYGVPQRRERVFIVGTRKGSKRFQPPVATHDRTNWRSASSAIGDLEHSVQDAQFSHVWSFAKKSSDQGGRVLNPHMPAHTIRAECHGNNQFHYAEPRRISMREAARFQSFPDEFLFKARLRETERQVGNAVPPVLAWHIAGAVLQALR